MVGLYIQRPKTLATMEEVIQFILTYWFVAALIVAAWAFFKFSTYKRKPNPKYKTYI